MFMQMFRVSISLVVLGMTACGGGGSGNSPVGLSSLSVVSSSSSVSSSASVASSSSSLAISSSSSMSSVSSASSSSAAPLFVTVSGQVMDERGVPITGASLELIGTNVNVVADADGRFSVELSTQLPAVVRVKKSGYAHTIRAAESAEENIGLLSRIIMPRVAVTLSIDPKVANILRVPGSTAMVDLPAASLVGENGAAAVGTVEASLTPIDPSQNVALMPGRMVDASTGDAIESLGAMNVEFTDVNGKPLNLATGKKATIRIPATPAESAVPPPSMPLYHLNETTGEWRKEGSASLQTDPISGERYYQGLVSHFSWWNADDVYNTMQINYRANAQGGVCSYDGFPIGSKVVVEGIEFTNIVAADLSIMSKKLIITKASSKVAVYVIDTNFNVMDQLIFRTDKPGSIQPLSRCLKPAPLVNVMGNVKVVNGKLDDYWIKIYSDSFGFQTTAIDSQGRYATQVPANSGLLNAKLVSVYKQKAEVSANVANSDVQFPDLELNDKEVVIHGCVDAWAGYRQDYALVSVHGENESPQSAPVSVTSSSNQFSVLAQMDSTATITLTPPDANLREITTSVSLGKNDQTLPECLHLPHAPLVKAISRANGLSISFDASATQAGDAPITGFNWDFGDGSSSTGSKVLHNYAQEGQFIVTLTVSDQLNQKTILTGDAATFGRLSGTAMSGGQDHTCAITPKGALVCWGLNTYGQLGNGTFTNSSIPVAVTGLESGVVAVSAGINHTCAVSADGVAKCWGYNGSGRLGDGTEVTRAIPTAVSGLVGASTISAGGEHTCVVTASGGAKCWGVNNNGELGHIGPSVSLSPVDVTGLTAGVVDIKASLDHTCALTTDGGVKCWGFTGSGRLGNGGSGNFNSPLPQSVVGLESSASAISVGSEHSCALTKSGGMKCWGSNSWGMLGNGSKTTSLVPQDVVGATSGITAIGTGGNHSCALTKEGLVKCWGDNSLGALGAGPSLVASLIPLEVPDIKAKALAIGRYHSCIESSTNQLVCWGWNATGQLGNNSTVDSSVPVNVVNVP